MIKKAEEIRKEFEAGIILNGIVVGGVLVQESEWDWDENRVCLRTV
jgi:hypothetical protein